MGGARSPPCDQAVTIRYTGERIKRLEDPRLLRGRGRYLDDLVLPRMLALAFVRCPHAHAVVEAIDATAARALPGVAAVLTADDLDSQSLAPGLMGPGFVPTAWPALAATDVQYAGQAVAMVVAETAPIAADARERV